MQENGNEVVEGVQGCALPKPPTPLGGLVVNRSVACPPALSGVVGTMAALPPLLPLLLRNPVPPLPWRRVQGCVAVMGVQVVCGNYANGACTATQPCTALPPSVVQQPCTLFEGNGGSEQWSKPKVIMQ